MITGNVLFLAANPQSTERLALDVECRNIDERLKLGPERPLKFESRWAVRTIDLQQALLEVAPTVVHFSGHGAGTSGIVLAGKDDSAVQHVDGAALRGLFAAFADTVKVVVLNACWAEAQAQAIVEVVDAVVGMRDAVADEAALAFSLAFYQALAFGKPVAQAFALGVNQIELEGLADQRDVPVLLQRKQVTDGGP
ncbi:MAG TPA: CHAT domain-containing protein [Nannocystaceae bacterium]|nr:CHAT domain-containing protein [Nannocystaceae bacterium]